MNQTLERPSPEVLRSLHRMDELAPSDLRELAARLQVFSALSGTRLVELGSDNETTLYLLDGRIELLAEDGHKRTLDASDKAARRPLCRLRPTRYRVTALSNVQYLLVENDVLEDYLAMEESSSLMVDENSYSVDEASFNLESNTRDQLMTQVLDSISQGTLVLPSLPQVAEKVGRAILAAGQDTRRLTRALMVDPTLATKTIKAVNAHLAAKDSPVDTCEEAVQRLGSERVISLVVNCVLRESLRNPRPEIAARMQTWWERSLRVSAISYVLARLSERFNPDFAALAGLLHRIGEAVLLHYANELDTPMDEQELDPMLATNTREVGRILLAMWNLSPELVTVVSESGNLTRKHTHAADYADIVLVAERHADIGQRVASDPTAPDQMPAFHLLGLGDVSPEFSLQIVEAANGALAQADALLAA